MKNWISLFLILTMAACGDAGSPSGNGLNGLGEGEGGAGGAPIDPEPEPIPVPEPTDPRTEPEPEPEPEPWEWPEGTLIPNGETTCLQSSVQDFETLDTITYDAFVAEELPENVVSLGCDVLGYCSYEITLKPLMKYVEPVGSPFLDIPAINQGPCYNPDFHDRVPDFVEVCVMESIQGNGVEFVTETCAVPAFDFDPVAETITVPFASIIDTMQGDSGWVYTQINLEWHTY